MKDWIQTFTGKKVFPLEPDSIEVDIVDIAHSLANQCRWGGHVSQFYCPVMDELILTDELAWIPAEEATIGTRLIGFDETAYEAGSAGHLQRRIRPTVVSHFQPVKRRVLRLEMEDGSTVKCSSEHPWLIATKSSGNQTWRTSESIRQDILDGRKRYIHKFISPWKEEISREAGWLSGIFDGEGSISFYNHGVICNIGQNPGIVLDKIEFLLRYFNFDYSRYENNGKEYQGRISRVTQLQLKGGWREFFRLLGQIKPIRLLDKFQNGFRTGEFCKQLQSAGTPLAIVKTYDEGTGWCAGIETSTHTYICNGFGAHNSVGQHSVYVAQNCSPENKIYGLLHDASEAYLVDLPTPVKNQIPEYRLLEGLVQNRILTHFGLRPGEEGEVIYVDKRMLATEAHQLMSPLHKDFTLSFEPYKFRIMPWSIDRTKAEFLHLFDQLIKI